MNKKIKIIELFNKIFNGEEVPKKIEYQDKIFEKSEDYDYTTDDGIPLVHLLNYNLSNLNDEVEILEDNTEEIDYIGFEANDWYKLKETSEIVTKFINEQNNKINELVKAVNKMKEKDK